MRHQSKLICLYVALTVAGNAWGKSFLTAQSFPKTFNDVPFIDRMEILADGYDDFDPEYDENGNCVSGCAYRGIKLEDELAAITRNTEAARQQFEQYKLTHPEEFSNPPQAPSNNNDNNPAGNNNTGPTQAAHPTAQPNQNVPVPNNTPAAQQGPSPTPARPSANSEVARQCAQYSNTIRPGTYVISAPPLDGELVITSDFGTRAKPCARCSAQHRGVDLSAPIGTNVYTPANGTVASVTDASSDCGNGVVIDHPNRYRTVYCHLSMVAVKVGDTVQGGCLIGQTGNTGASTGPHLHYAIKYNGAWIDPLYPTNRLVRDYRFAPGAKVSKEHAGKVLPGKLN